MAETAVEYKLYHSITQTPLSAFVKAVCDNDLQALVIEGDVPDPILKAVFIDLKTSFSEALGGTEVSVSLNLFKRISLQTTKLIQVYTLLAILREVYVKEFATELNRLLVTVFEFDPANREQYFRFLDSCSTRAKRIEVDIELKMASYEEIQKGSGEGESVAPTHEYFQEWLNTLSEHNKYQIIAEQITVYQFCDKIKRFNSYIKMLQNRQK